MKPNEANVFVFIASVIIGILISLNINFNKTYNRVFLSAKQYQDAYNLKNKLRSDISNLEEQYYLYYNKATKYDYSDKNQIQVLQEMKSELDKNKMILGEADVEGEGVKITLNDASTDFSADYVEYMEKIIHNYDIIQVLNDLKNAGAEAVSINGQRVIERSEVYCNGPFIKVNGVKIAAPFYIFAIGNKEVLKNYMLLDENHLKTLINRQINVDVAVMDKIKITAYENSIDSKHLASVK